MKKFWFEFQSDKIQLPPGLGYGCGITARDLDDATLILKESVFRKKNISQIFTCIENVDVSTLDPDHVIPNINPLSPPSIRGVWFPSGYT
jgi:hypothetical protein